jgi:hypothetical protein
MNRSTFRLASVAAFLKGVEFSMSAPSEADLTEALRTGDASLPLTKAANRYSVMAVQDNLDKLEEG